MEAGNDGTLKRRGSGGSIALSKTPSKAGMRPKSLDRNALQEYQDWQAAYAGSPYAQSPGPYPILVNPPPLPTVTISKYLGLNFYMVQKHLFTKLD